MTKSSNKREKRNKLIVQGLCIVLAVALIVTMVLTVFLH